ncbi:MAG: hypothetical protein P8X95_17615 [Anaerolineales bacterium]
MEEWKDGPTQTQVAVACQDDGTTVQLSPKRGMEGWKNGRMDGAQGPVAAARRTDGRQCGCNSNEEWKVAKLKEWLDRHFRKARRRKYDQARGDYWTGLY